MLSMMMEYDRTYVESASATASGLALAIAAAKTSKMREIFCAAGSLNPSKNVRSALSRVIPRKSKMSQYSG